MTLHPHEDTNRFAQLIASIAYSATEHGMGIVSCAEEIDLIQYGIRNGRCIDDEYIRDVFGIRVGCLKDPNQRQACQCVISKDVGAYDTCLHGCQYCYAVSSHAVAKRNASRHDPNLPSLLR